MKDFSIKIYRELLSQLKSHNYEFYSVQSALSDLTGGRKIILRHDVDLLPDRSLEFARIEAGLGIKGTYYFRVVPGSFNERIIRNISELGHEVGYHYEDLSFARAKLKADGGWRRADGEELEKVLVNIGIESFKENLEKLRRFVPVKTICMHGSPISRWDSRLLWEYYDYHDFGIIGEPYFDVNFDEILYLTDTGRRWDGDSVNIRDKAVPINRDLRCATTGGRQKAEGSRLGSTLQPSAFSPQPATLLPRFHSTFDIIKATEQGELPDKIMMTFHPQRWTDRPVPWMKELVWQNVKNVGKYFLVRRRAQC